MEITNSSECIAASGRSTTAHPKRRWLRTYLCARRGSNCHQHYGPCGESGVSQFSVVYCVKTAGYKAILILKLPFALGMNQSKMHLMAT
jgi:hypothetical protein